MMSRAIVRDGRIILGNNGFKALVIPGVKRLPVKTLEQIVQITLDGGRVIFQDGIPGDVPGFADVETRRKASGELVAKAKGKFTEVSGSILPALAESSVRRESMTGSGLRFVRRSHAEGFNYFIVNRSGKDFDGNLTLATDFQSALVLDPWHPEKAGVVTNKAIPIRLAPLQSIVIRTFTHKKVSGTPWSLAAAAPTAIPLGGPWKVEFTAGGPVLPKPAELASTRLMDHPGGSRGTQFLGHRKILHVIRFHRIHRRHHATRPRQCRPHRAGLSEWQARRQLVVPAPCCRSNRQSEGRAQHPRHRSHQPGRQPHRRPRPPEDPMETIP